MMRAVFVSIVLGMIFSSLLASVLFVNEKVKAGKRLEKIKLMKEIGSFIEEYFYLKEENKLVEYPSIENYLFSNCRFLNNFIVDGNLSLKKVKLIKLDNYKVRALQNEILECFEKKDECIIDVLTINASIVRNIHSKKNPIKYRLRGLWLDVKRFLLPKVIRCLLGIIKIIDILNEDEKDFTTKENEMKMKAKNGAILDEKCYQLS